jgi:NAD-specific glutamate dehydrogenase
MADLIGATLRTSYFQNKQKGDKIIFKFDTSNLALVPEPRPFREIFVFSRRFEGVHLRGGPVARGGLRWSDRMEDYRTEVLGLVKAQMVKNAVIVPAGAKGGFVCKQMPKDAVRETIAAEGEAVYRLFISSLLEVTDNRVLGKIVPPPIPSATTATIRTWWWRPTRARQPSPTSPTASLCSAASGSVTRLHRAARTATTTRRWASPPRARSKR